MKKIYIGSDHAGFDNKQNVIAILNKLKIPFQDVGVYNKDVADYPLVAKKVCVNVLKNKTRGILLCGTGIGMSIAANRNKGIRAALVYEPKLAQISREHNDSNVLVLSGMMSPSKIEPTLKLWFNTEFKGLSRYKRRHKQLG